MNLVVVIHCLHMSGQFVCMFVPTFINFTLRADSVLNLEKHFI